MYTTVDDTFSKVEGIVVFCMEFPSYQVLKSCKTVHFTLFFTISTGHFSKGWFLAVLLSMVKMITPPLPQHIEIETNSWAETLHSIIYRATKSAHMLFQLIQKVQCLFIGRIDPAQRLARIYMIC